MQTIDKAALVNRFEMNSVANLENGNNGQSWFIIEKNKGHWESLYCTSLCMSLYSRFSDMRTFVLLNPFQFYSKTNYNVIHKKKITC